MSPSKLVKLLTALTAIYKVSFLRTPFSFKEIILYIWRNSISYYFTFLILLYALIGTSLTLITIAFACC